jgi:hypothetical protein
MDEMMRPIWKWQKITEAFAQNRGHALIGNE